MEKHIDKIEWNYICYYQKLDLNFIEKHKKNVILNLLLSNRKISNEIKEKIKEII
jgi:hypothetical protein